MTKADVIKLGPEPRRCTARCPVVVAATCDIMSNQDVDQLQDERGFGASAASSLYMPWQTLQVLATETGQAVRDTFSESRVSTSGHVQQGQPTHALPAHHTTDQSYEPQALLDSCEVGTVHLVTDAPIRDHDNETVQAEIARVNSKMLSADAATEVILRFNFLSGRESRVGFTVRSGLQVWSVMYADATNFCRLHCCALWCQYLWALQC